MIELALAVFIPLALYLASWLWDKFGPEYNKLDKLIMSKGVQQELAKILEEEGGIDEFMKKYKPDMYPDDNYDPAIIWNSGGYNSARWIEYTAGKHNTVHKIIDRILDCKPVQDWFIKHKKGKFTRKALGNSLYFILTSRTFNNQYEDMLARAAKFQAKELEKELKRKKKGSEDKKDDTLLVPTSLNDIQKGD